MSSRSEVRVTGRSGRSPGQGPFLELQLNVIDGVIRQASYETYQCPGSHACGKAICEMVTGRSLTEARAIRHQDLVEKVGQLPAHRRVSYGLALLALADALAKLTSSRAEVTNT